MPTKNPRISIMVPPLLAAQLRRLSELTGNSQSALVGELLEGSETVFARLIRVLEAAQEARHSMRDSLVNDLENAQGRVEQQLGLALDLVDHHAPLLDGVEDIKRRAGRGGSAAATARAPAASVTPLSNRGVRSNRKTGKNVMPTRT
jgi:hypothetical protein